MSTGVELDGLTWKRLQGIAREATKKFPRARVNKVVTNTVFANTLAMMLSQGMNLPADKLREVSDDYIAGGSAHERSMTVGDMFTSSVEVRVWIFMHNLYAYLNDTIGATGFSLREGFVALYENEKFSEKMAEVAARYDARVAAFIAVGHRDRDTIEQMIASGVDPQLALTLKA